MNTEQAMVREFHTAFNHPVAHAPERLPENRVRARAEWMREEVDEFEDAETLDEQVDAVIDLMYFALGAMVELGVESSPVFEIVHRANMAKLGPDGLPRLRQGDRKVVKPSDWVDPKDAIVREIARQHQEAMRENRTRRSA